jgi:hypothetical protein
MIKFRRFSKRRQRAAMLVAALDKLEWGQPTPKTNPTRAYADGLCVACGTIFHEGEQIVLVGYGPKRPNYNGWAHDYCPNVWLSLGRTLERYDDKIITRIQQEGRGRADCGHLVEGKPVYLVRQPVSLDSDAHSKWTCESCATAGGSEEVT